MPLPGPLPSRTASWATGGRNNGSVQGGLLCVAAKSQDGHLMPYLLCLHTLTTRSFLCLLLLLVPVSRRGSTVDILDMKLKHAPCIGSAVFPPAIYFSINNPGSLSSTTPAECHPRLWIHTIKRGQGPGKANGSLRGASKKQILRGKLTRVGLGRVIFEVVLQENLTCMQELAPFGSSAGPPQLAYLKIPVLIPGGKGGRGVSQINVFYTRVANIRNFPLKDVLDSGK